MTDSAAGDLAMPQPQQGAKEMEAEMGMEDRESEKHSEEDTATKQESGGEVVRTASATTSASQKSVDADQSDIVSAGEKGTVPLSVEDDERGGDGGGGGGGDGGGGEDAGDEGGGAVEDEGEDSAGEESSQVGKEEEMAEHTGSGGVKAEEGGGAASEERAAWEAKWFAFQRERG